MISGVAKLLQIGERVVAVKDGFSDGVFYRRGDTGAVVEKVNDTFRVRLDSGKETAFVPAEKWEREVELRGKTAQTAASQASGVSGGVKDPAAAADRPAAVVDQNGERIEITAENYWRIVAQS